MCVYVLSGLPTLQHHIINLSSPSTFSLCLCVSSVVVASFFIFSIHSCARAHAHFEIAIRLFYFFFHWTEQGRVRHFSFRNASELHTQVNLSAGKCMSNSISWRERERERMSGPLIEVKRNIQNALEGKEMCHCVTDCV